LGTISVSVFGLANLTAVRRPAPKKKAQQKKKHPPSMRISVAKSGQSV
jgi:hypothetical protein